MSVWRLNDIVCSGQTPKGSTLDHLVYHLTLVSDIGGSKDGAYNRMPSLMRSRAGPTEGAPARTALHSINNASTEIVHSWAQGR